jgi:ribosomal protein L3
MRALASEENEWKSKQKGYQGEVKRWNQEVERQKKLSDSYNSLAEVK